MVSPSQTVPDFSVTRRNPRQKQTAEKILNPVLDQVLRHSAATQPRLQYVTTTIGVPGEGKTHLAIALGVEAIWQTSAPT